TLDLGPDCEPVARIDQIRPRQDDNMSAPNRTDRFAEQAAGKQASESEGLKRVNQDNVEVPRQSPVLKSVIEHDQLGIKLSLGDFHQGNAIGVLKVGYVGKIFLEYTPLVVQSRHLPVAPAEDGDSHSVPAKPARKPLDHRGFPSAPQRDVSHGNH